MKPARNRFPGFFLSIGLLALLAPGVMADHPPHGFFRGDYRVVGVDPLTQQPYQGLSTIETRDDALFMVRKIGRAPEKEVQLKIHVEGPDELTSLVSRYKNKEGSEYVTHYQINGDHDNYARLTGRVYVTGHKPRIAGLEALFFLQDDLGKELEKELKSLRMNAAAGEKKDAAPIETLLRAIGGGAMNDEPDPGKPVPPSLSHPATQRILEKYEEADTPEKHEAIIPRLQALQRSHREIFDVVTVGEPVFGHSGLLALGRLRHVEKSEMGEAHYQLTIGVRPRTAGDNQRCLTALEIRFDESGVVAGKSIPRYKW